MRIRDPSATRSYGSTEAISLGDLGKFLAKGARVAKSFVVKTARDQSRRYYEKLDKWLAKQSASGGETESGVAYDHNSSNKEEITDEQAAALLATRAVVADCALQAVLKADKKELAESRILGDATSVEPESFFDSMLKTIQRIGPVVKKHGPKVIGYSLPLIIKGLKACIDANSNDEDEESAKVASESRKGKERPIIGGGSKAQRSEDNGEGPSRSNKSTSSSIGKPTSKPTSRLVESERDEEESNHGGYLGEDSNDPPAPKSRVSI